MEEILAAVRELGARMTSMENRIAAIDGRIAAIEGGVTGIDGRLDEVMKFMRSQPDIKLLLVRQKAAMEEQRAMRGDMVMIKSQMNDFYKHSVTEGEIQALHEAVNRTTEEQYMLSARLDAVEKA